MKRSELRRQLEAALADLTGVHADLDPLLTVLDQYAGGYPADHSYERPVVSSSPSTAGVDRAAFQPDPAAAARRRLEARVANLTALTAEIVAIHRHWRTPGTVGAKPGEGMPGCQVMAAVGVWEQGRVTTANGNLDQPMRLGVWARRFVITNGRLPTEAEAEAHATGRKVHPTDGAAAKRRKNRKRKAA